MSKLFGFFCSGASRQSEVGGEQAIALGDQALGSIASDQSCQVLIGLRSHVCDGEGGPNRELFNVHMELFEVPPDWVEGAVPQTIGVPSLYFLSFSLQ